MGQTCGKSALGTHLSQQQQAAAFGEAHRLEAINDTRARNDMGICDIRPVSNLVDATAILTHHSVADVSKLAVLKYQEVCNTRGHL